MSFKIELLNFIKDAGEMMPGIEFPYEYARRLTLRMNRATYYGTMYRMEKQKLIKRKNIPKGPYFGLTDQGRKLLEKPAVLKKRNDGSSTIVIFDVPESKRTSRNYLRRYLLRNGFRTLQKSVYISRNKVPGAIVELTKELGLGSYVSVIGGKIEYYL